jgi:hypothetical protein
MGYLKGLNEYIKAEYAKSVFDQAVTSQIPYEIHMHGFRIIKARIIENLVFDIRADIEGQGEEVLSKIQIKFLYPADQAETVRPLIKIDKKVKALGLEAILDFRVRYYVKNKTLYPLMKEREVLFFTLLEGDVLRGLVTDFTRFDLTLSFKGGILVTLLRHAIYDLRNKQGDCLLRRVQEEKRDWEKSSWYVSE